MGNPLDLDSDFLDMTPKTRVKMDKWDYTKKKNFYIAKETISTMKKQLIQWKKIFSNNISNKGLISKTYKGFL